MLSGQGRLNFSRNMNQIYMISCPGITSELEQLLHPSLESHVLYDRR